ncbi:uncharacterized protein LOC135397576 [Ornithodoros turicata]|uniref:uncharacterized protein LOC135397576 n=1 Tax=Ornithodoros turicata TaxID=34597 RepID=UPI003138AD05
MMPYSARDIQNVQLREDSRAAVSNVLSYFKREAQQQKVACHVTKVIRRTSCATGLPKHMVLEAVNNADIELDADSDVEISLSRIINDDMGMCVLRRQILFYCSNYDQPPTLKIVRDMIKEQFNIACSKSSALTILNKLGFHFRELPGSNRSVLLEDSSVAAKRLVFLRKLRDYRTEGREVVYVGGTIIPLGTPPSASPQQLGGSRSLLLVHAGYLAELLPLKSMFKFEAANPAHQLSQETFHSWVAYQLLPFLPKDAVVVFVNVPFGKVLREDVPTLQSSRWAICECLIRHHIRFSESASKAELLELYWSYAGKGAKSQLWLESIIEDSGHITLRMPQFLVDLNPMERVWQTLNDQIAETQPKVVTLRVIEEVMQQGPLYHMLMRAWTHHLAQTQEIEDALLEWSEKIERKVEDMLSGKMVPHMDSEGSDSEGSDMDSKSLEEKENTLEPNSDDLVIDLGEDPRRNVAPMQNRHSNVDYGAPLTSTDARVMARLEDFDWICSDVEPSVWRDVACLVSDVVRQPDATA